MASCSFSDQIFIMSTSSSYTIKCSGSFSTCTHSQWHKLASCKASMLDLVTPRFQFPVLSRTKYPLKTGIWMHHGLPSLVSQRISGLCFATKGDGEELILEPSYEIPQLSFLDKHPTVATGFLFFEWSILNAIFNVLNKKIYFYFPYPFFMSVVQLTVGGIYSVVCWTLRTPKRAPLTKELIYLLLPLSFCHAFGHMMTNVSFSTVAVSFTHTIKALEPFFNAAASQFFLSSPVPLTVWLSLVPVVLGVVLASVTEVSFNWKGFLSAILSNVAYTYRNIYSKQAMKGVDSTNLYYYITLLSLILCIPPAIVIEGPALMQHGLPNVIASVGYKKFLYDLLVSGLFYHLYQQIGNNTLERVSPLSHAVGNVLKRVVVITFSILVFGNRITLQTGVGTTIAITGVALYSYLNAQKEAQKVGIKGTTE